MLFINATHSVCQPGMLLQALCALEYPARHEIEQRGARGLVFVVNFVKKIWEGNELLVAGTERVDERP
jgi:hypothetical protein